MRRQGYTKSKLGEYQMHPGWTMPTKPCKRGHLVPRTTNGSCAQCLRDYRKEKGHYAETTRLWLKENKELATKRSRDYWNIHPEKRMLNSARQTAKAKGLPFDIDLGDIIIPETCPVLGLKIEKVGGERTANSPSLDRIIPEKGYTKGNVIVVSWRVNRIKADSSLTEMKALVSFYERIILEENP